MPRTLVIRYGPSLVPAVSVTSVPLRALRSDRGRWNDVRIQTEEVVGVVRRLDALQPHHVAAIALCGKCARGFVGLSNEARIRDAVRERRDLLEAVAYPRDVGSIVGRILPVAVDRRHPQC